MAIDPMRAPAFWQKKSLFSDILVPFGLIFGACTEIRRRIGANYRAACPVICIGNLVAGGAGKTPIALAVAERLQAADRKVHFLSRGYGGRESGPLRVDPERHTALDVGDEPLLLAARAPTFVSADRSAGAAMAAKGADVVVMDDGFQNGNVQKDISILVVDGVYGFGNGRVMPAGPLRETLPGGLARADMIVVLGGNVSSIEGVSPPTVPILLAQLEPVENAAEFRGRRFIAFAGIGRPQKFFDTVGEIGCEVVDSISYPDHHVFQAVELAELRSQAKNQNAELLTTEKDFVRIGASRSTGITPLKVRVVWHNAARLDEILAEKAGDG
jgi:tetraacyldisaccharide 4'-kinase